MRKASTVKRGVDLPRVAPSTEPMPGYGNARGVSGSAWAKIRTRILRRDGGLCQCHECKEAERYEIAHHVDHIDNRRGPGYSDDDNLQAINRECHKRKTALEVLIGRGLAQRPPWMCRGMGG